MGCTKSKVINEERFYFNRKFKLVNCVHMTNIKYSMLLYKTIDENSRTDVFIKQYRSSDIFSYADIELFLERMKDSIFTTMDNDLLIDSIVTVADKKKSTLMHFLHIYDKDLLGLLRKSDP